VDRAESVNALGDGLGGPDVHVAVEVRFVESDCALVGVYAHVDVEGSTADADGRHGGRTDVHKPGCVVGNRGRSRSRADSSTSTVVQKCLVRNTRNIVETV